MALLFMVNVVITVALVFDFTRLDSPGSGRRCMRARRPDRFGEPGGGYALLGLATVLVLFGLYLILPQFH